MHMKKWLILLCVAMGLLLVIGLWFIAVGLRQDNTQKQLQQQLEESPNTEKALAFFNPSEKLPAGEAAHV